MAVNQPEQSARSYFILLVVAGITLSGIVLQSWKVQNAQAANAEDGQHDEEETSEVPPDVAFVNELRHADDDLPEEDKRQYDVARQYLFDVDQSRRFDAETRRKLSDVERKADKVLAAIREKELSQYQGHNDFPPANSFYEGVHAIPKSDVFRILKKMPKGGALHIHASSFGDADTLVNLATLEECLVEVLKDTEEAVELSGRIALQSKQDSVPENYQYANKVIAKMGHDKFRNVMQDQLTLDLEDEQSKDVWGVFNKTFHPYGAALAYEKIFEAYFMDACEELVSDNVQYVELRSGIADVLSLDGATSDTIAKLWEVRNEMQAKHPHFDMKIIISSWRGNATGNKDKLEERTEAVRKSLRAAMKKRQDYPEFIIGFDLVGHEDYGRTTGSFRDVFLDIPAYRKEFGVDMPLFFHDGESIWADDQNIVDAYLIGTKRIGHGLNLYLYPTVQQRLIEQDVALEVCPISNQILGFVRDLRSHPAIYYMRQGVPVVLSSDDPAIFGYEGLTHDFWVAYMAWDLDLASLKQLAINSIRYSGMTEAEKAQAMTHWSQQWERFVNSLLEDPARPKGV